MKFISLAARSLLSLTIVSGAIAIATAQTGKQKPTPSPVPSPMPQQLKVETPATPAANPADVASIDAIVAAVYADEKPFARGINSIQLMNDGKRWWVVTIFWQGEDEKNPLPEKYLKHQ